MPCHSVMCGWSNGHRSRWLGLSGLTAEPSPAANRNQKTACLIVEPLQCGKLFLAAKPGLRNRGLQHPDRLIVDRDRHRKGMAVLLLPPVRAKFPKPSIKETVRPRYPLMQLKT